MTDASTPSISATLRHLNTTGVSIIWIAETLRADGHNIDPKTLTKLLKDPSGGLSPDVLNRLNLALHRRQSYFQEYVQNPPPTQLAYVHAQQHSLPDTSVTYENYLAFITPLFHKDTERLTIPSLLHNLDPDRVDLSTASSDTRRFTLKLISGLLRNVTNTRHSSEALEYITEHATRNGQQAEPLLALLQNSLPLTRGDQLHTIRQLHRAAHSIYSQHHYTIPQVTSDRTMLTDALRALRGLELVFIGGRYRDTPADANAGTYIVNFINVVQTTNPVLFHAARADTNDDPERIHNNIVRLLTNAMNTAQPSVPELSAPQPEPDHPDVRPAVPAGPQPSAPELSAPQPEPGHPDARPAVPAGPQPSVPELSAPQPEPGHPDAQPAVPAGPQPDLAGPDAAQPNVTPPAADISQPERPSPAHQTGGQNKRSKVGHRDNLINWLNSPKRGGTPDPTPPRPPAAATAGSEQRPPDSAPIPGQPVPPRPRPAQSAYFNDLSRSGGAGTPEPSTPAFPPRPAPPAPGEPSSPVRPVFNPPRRRAGTRSPLNMHDAFRQIHTTDEQTLDYVRSFMPQQLLASPDILRAIETDDSDSPAGQAILAANEARAHRERRVASLKTLEEQFAPALLILKHAATPYPSRDMAAAFTEVDRLTELPSLDLNTLTPARRRTVLTLLGVQGPDVDPTPEYLSNALLHPRTSSAVRTARKIYDLLRSVHHELHLMMSRGASESQLKLTILDLLTPDMHAPAALAFNLHPNVFTNVTHGQMTTLLTAVRWVHTQHRLRYTLLVSDGTETLETLAVKLLPGASLTERQAFCDAVTGPGVPAVIPTSQAMTKLECDITRVALNDAGLHLPGVNGLPDQNISTEQEKYALITHARQMLQA